MVLLLPLVDPHPVDLHGLGKALEIVELVAALPVRAGIVWAPDAEVVASDGKVQDQVEGIITVDLPAAEL